MPDENRWTPATRVLAGVALTLTALTATMNSCGPAEPDPRPEVVWPDDEPTGLLLEDFP